MARFDINFRLKEPNSEKSTYIFLSISILGRLRISTKEKILPTYWDSDNQRPTTDRKALRSVSPLILKELKYISSRLDEIEYQLSDSILELKRDKNLQKEAILEEINRIIGREEKKKEEKIPTITEYYQLLINRMKEGSLLTPKGTKYSSGTIKSHNTGKGYLEYYQEIYGDLFFDDITMDFKSKFIEVMNKKEFKLNTINRAFAFIKFVMGKSMEEGLHNNTYFQTSDFDVAEEDVDNIYLTSDDLKELYALDLSNNPAWERIRDVFLIGCFTALRYSDYSRIIPEYIRMTEGGTKVINMVTQKTKERVIIPILFPELELLLKKYNNRIPKTYEQKINENIKKIAEMAGIIQDVVVNETIGGVHKETIEKKYNLISTHTARRTGATNLYKLGFSTLEIMKITGHTSEKTFLKYIKVSKEENADLMAKKVLSM